MKKIFEKIIVLSIYLFCMVVITELGVNFSSFYYLFPIKNSTSYGYITKKSNKVVIPLNKYSTRFKAQLALPYELINSAIVSEKKLTKAYNQAEQKYGYIDDNNKTVIDFKYDSAYEFKNDYAIVAIKETGTKKFGTIDKKGNWIIKPKYTYLCPFAKYYTKACLDSKHCGIIDRFGNEITLMSYRTDKLNCSGANCITKFCSIGSNKNGSCNYFL